MNRIDYTKRQYQDEIDRMLNELGNLDMEEYRMLNPKLIGLDND